MFEITVDGFAVASIYSESLFPFEVNVGPSALQYLFR